MLSRALHGALLGAVLLGLLGLFEVWTVLRLFPYHRDPALWLQLFPLYAGVGGVLGATFALGLPLASSRRQREGEPRLTLSAVVLAGFVTIGLLAQTHMAWLPEAWPSTGIPAIAVSLGVLLGGFVLARLLARLANGAFAWLVGCLFSPLVVGALGALLLLSALLSPLMPVRDALVSQRGSPLWKDRPPNVLLIVLDTVSTRHLKTYGYERDTDPALRALAESGVVFENAFATAPWTLPSHAGLFSGLHGTTTGTGWEHPRLEDGQAQVMGRPLGDFHTIAEELGLRGYQTASIHEKSWITFGSGLTQGFQVVHDYSLASAGDLPTLPKLLDMVGARFGWPKPDEVVDKGGSRVVDTAIDWLDGDRARDEDRPFFLFLNLNEAHDPYEPPDEYYARYLPAGVTVEQARAIPQDVADRKAHEEQAHLTGSPIDPEEIEILKALYDAEIRYQDDLLDRLFTGMQELDLLEDTLVIVTADHGEEFDHNHRLGHQLALTDHLVHVPLIMRYPRALRAGLRVEALASLVDVFPTVLDLCQVESGNIIPISREVQALEGVSLLDLQDVLNEDGLARDRANRPQDENQEPIPRMSSERVRDFVLAHYANPAPYLRTYPFLSPPEGSSAEPGLIEDFPLKVYLRSIDMIRTREEKLLVFGDGRWSSYTHEPDGLEPNEHLYLDPSVIPPNAATLGSYLDTQLNFHLSNRLLLLSPLNEMFGTTGATQSQGTQGTEQLGYVESSDLSVPADFKPRPIERAEMFPWD